MSMNEARLIKSLKQYIGTETWFRHELFRFFKYTEGVQFMAEEAGAYWLIDLILGLQHENAAVKQEPFQLWKLTTENNTGKLSCEDGNGNEVFSQEISYTDFSAERDQSVLHGFCPASPVRILREGEKAMKHNFSSFKQDINLTQYAASMGYALDKKKSTKSSIVMRHGNGDKVIISRKGKNWVYFSVHDDADNGTIVDFIQKRAPKSIGEIGQELQTWLGGGAVLPDPCTYTQGVEEHKPDRPRVLAVFRNAKPVAAHPYLVNERKIPAALLSSSRFKGRIFNDRYGNAMFPHRDAEGICGLELKNTDKGMQVRGGIKGLWTSNIFANDKTLVIAEVAIDALSYAAIFMKPDTAYAAVSGAMGPQQYPILTQLVRKIKNLETIILATDNDEGGDSIAEKLEAYLREQGFTGEIRRHSPEGMGDDWNEVLKMLPY